MQKKFKKLHVIAGILGILIAFCWINNSNIFSDNSGNYKLLAHRGLGQTFDISKVEWDTNTAEIIYTPEHSFMENTIPSIKESFKYGADVVEIDIQRTKDNKLALFHDHDLSYRTEGSGRVADYTMEELKKLDVGYRYTADNGKTYPFRGKGVGLMPEFMEVVDKFPNKEFLIDLKEGDKKAAEILWSYLDKLPEKRQKQFTFYGGEETMSYLRKKDKKANILSKKRLMNALIRYELLGWTGYIPEEIKNMELHIPLTYAKFLWGWPTKFVDRMESVNTRVVIVAGNGKWSEGFDNADMLKSIPEGFAGYVWTNRIDKIEHRK